MVNPKALGLAGGILWGASMLIITFLNIYTGYASMWTALFVDVYPGYSVTFPGAFIGLVYGFFDAFIGLFILGWLYNKFNCCSSHSHCHKEQE